MEEPVKKEKGGFFAVLLHILPLLDLLFMAVAYALDSLHYGETGALYTASAVALVLLPVLLILCGLIGAIVDGIKLARKKRGKLSGWLLLALSLLYLAFGIGIYFVLGKLVN